MDGKHTMLQLMPSENGARNLPNVGGASKTVPRLKRDVRSIVHGYGSTHDCPRTTPPFEAQPGSFHHDASTSFRLPKRFEAGNHAMRLLLLGRGSFYNRPTVSRKQSSLSQFDRHS